jgi:MoaA/NifB/PqqE/SkfB family radical SAM enzyme
MKKINYLLKLAINEPDYVINLFKHRLINLFNFKIPKLKKISFLLTYKCNLSCSMCALGKNNKFEQKIIYEELSLKDIKNIIDFAQISNSVIWLTGGEPLLNSKWTEIAKYIKEKNLRCYLQTNGILLEKYKEEIIKYIDFLNVSIDGIPSEHNFIRGEKNAFEKVMAGLKKIQEEKRKNNKKKPYINICYTVTQESYLSLDNLIKILQETEIEINNFNFQHLEFINREIFQKYKERFEKENKIEKIPEIFLINNQEIDGEYLTKKIQELKKRKFKFNIVFSPDISSEEIKRYYKEPHFLSKKIFRKCGRPYEEIFVHPQGEIWTCPSRVFGNFKKEKFEKIWERISEEARKNNEICQDCLGELYMYYMTVLYLLGERRCI